MTSMRAFKLLLVECNHVDEYTPHTVGNVVTFTSYKDFVNWLTNGNPKPTDIKWSGVFGYGKWVDSLLDDLLAQTGPVTTTLVLKIAWDETIRYSALSYLRTKASGTMAIFNDGLVYSSGELMFDQCTIIPSIDESVLGSDRYWVQGMVFGSHAFTRFSSVPQLLNSPKMKTLWLTPTEYFIGVNTTRRMSIDKEHIKWHPETGRFSAPIGIGLKPGFFGPKQSKSL